jgi:hypothetical protein
VRFTTEFQPFVDFQPSLPTRHAVERDVPLAFRRRGAGSTALVRRTRDAAFLAVMLVNLPLLYNIFPFPKTEDVRPLEDDVQPRAKDVPSRIGVPVVQGPAAIAYPRSHSQMLHPSRAAECAALGTHLGTVPLVRLNEACSMPNGLVVKHQAKRGPASIQDRLRHPGAGQGRAVHITDADQGVLPDDVSAGLVREVPPLGSDLPMYPARQRLAPGSLCARVWPLPCGCAPGPGQGDAAMTRSREAGHGRTLLHCHDGRGRLAGDLEHSRTPLEIGWLVAIRYARGRRAAAGGRAGAVG